MDGCDRGIRFIPGSHNLLLESSLLQQPNVDISSKEIDIVQRAALLWWNDTLVDSELHARDNAFVASKWRSIRCTASRMSLCDLVSSYRQQPVSSRFLPNFPSQVFLSQRDAKLLPMDVARMMGSGHCPESGTGRTAIAPQHASDVQQHDISLCNIIGLGSDYVYVPYTSRLYVLANPVGNVALVFMSLFMVYLMVVVGHNLQTVLGVSADDKGGENKARWSVACMLGLLMLACFSTGSDVMVGFVTLQDYVAFVTGTVYVAYYCIRVQMDQKRVSPVNPILASMAISVQRVYGSAENPYSQTVLFMVLTWLLHKISVMNVKAWMKNELKGGFVEVRWWRCLDVVADCLLISVMLYAGVLGQVCAYMHIKIFVKIKFPFCAYLLFMYFHI